MKKAIKILAIIFGGFISLVFIISLIGVFLSAITKDTAQVKETNTKITYATAKPRVTPRPSPTPLPLQLVKATDIIKLYKENELNADTLFKDKRCIIRGKINSISHSLGRTYVSIQGGEWEMISIRCYFDKDQVKSLIKLRKGEMCDIAGTIDGLALGFSISARDCILK